MDTDDRSQTDDGVVYSYNSRWISKLEGESRWRMYWQQQQLMDGLIAPGDELLEIGPGNGFTSNYLRSRGFAVTTLDIDEGKRPDIVANIVKYDFPTACDAILAFEVFEHIPYEEFEKVVPRLAAAARGHVFLSLPRNELVPFRISLKLGGRRREHTFERRRLEGMIRETHHFWELDHGDTTVSRVEALFAHSGLAVVRRASKGKFRYYALKTPKR